MAWTRVSTHTYTHTCKHVHLCLISHFISGTWGSHRSGRAFYDKWILSPVINKCKIIKIKSSHWISRVSRVTLVQIPPFLRWQTWASPWAAPDSCTAADQDDWSWKEKHIIPEFVPVFWMWSASLVPLTSPMFSPLVFVKSSELQ